MITPHLKKNFLSLKIFYFYLKLYFKNYKKIYFVRRKYFTAKLIKPCGNCYKNPFRCLLAHCATLHTHETWRASQHTHVPKPAHIQMYMCVFVCSAPNHFEIENQESSNHSCSQFIIKIRVQSPWNKRKYASITCNCNNNYNKHNNNNCTERNNIESATTLCCNTFNFSCM